MYANMNIVIVGCGNIGFEVARCLSETHRVLVISRSCPDYLSELLRKHQNVSFARANATDPRSIADALACDRTFERVDAMVCTVGAPSSMSVLDDFDQFKGSFHLNIVANLVPIRAILKRMIAAGSGRIIAISSTSGIFAYPGLTSYVPAKWALTSLCRALRREVEPLGISVDIVFPRSIRNRYSRTFLFDHGIEPDEVAGKIMAILKRPRNGDHCLPGHYALLRVLERIIPGLLDRKAGLRSERKNRFRSQESPDVLLTGASSPLGIEIAHVYARTSQRLCLVGEDGRALSKIKDQITQVSKCAVEISVLDLSDSRAVKRLAEQVGNVDLFIHNAIPHSVEKLGHISLEEFDHGLDRDFLGPVQLIAELLRRKVRPQTIINVLPVSAARRGPGHGCGAVCGAALWAFTRCLRRTFGNDMQVMEVLLPAFDNTEPSADNSERSSASVGGTGLTFRALAHRIHGAKTMGKEIVTIPFGLRLSIYWEAMFAGMFPKKPQHLRANKS